jgi:hypothetical protein
MHQPIPAQGRWLNQVVRGYFAYHAVPTNSRRLDAFRYHVLRLWHRTLPRRSQKDFTSWERISRLSLDYLPIPRVLHPWPSTRFDVNHPKVEAECLNQARSVLCGGRPVMGVPTAIRSQRVVSRNWSLDNWRLTRVKPQAGIDRNGDPT